MLCLGDLLTQVERKAPVMHVVLNNESLDFVNIERQEAGFVRLASISRIPILLKWPRPWERKASGSRSREM